MNGIEQDMFDFIDRCPDYRTTGPILADLMQNARRVGFECLIFSGIPLPGEALEPLVELNGWPAGWFERYVQGGYADIDAVCRHSRDTTRPFFWHEVPERSFSLAQARRVANEAIEFGLRDGYLVPAYSRRHWHALMSFSSPEKRLHLSSRERIAVNLMAMVTISAVETLRSEQDRDRLLSPREREVLQWAAIGKTADEIGDILNISTATVRKHLQNVRQSYGVSSTLAAVALALQRKHIRL
ncbi:MAG: autoinducer-binding protein [Rhizobiaceae bacterium]|nr:MAG: autoinducer-binding protein [Rhizobiaceae bacterium]